ncbi:hypothetical protein FACS1894158_12300 [Betaproteobacteria bacterium]|nr:hypothetical protein FACS1894158_12300 [Betaproteobacteria bacterium]
MIELESNAVKILWGITARGISTVSKAAIVAAPSETDIGVPITRRIAKAPKRIIAVILYSRQLGI